MIISLLVTGSPTASRACHSALGFARAVVHTDHELLRVFFYQEAVAIGNRYSEFPSDESNLRDEWAELAHDSNVELNICISASQRRGVTASNPSTVADGFQVTGLGPLAEAVLKSDRLVKFSS